MNQFQETPTDLPEEDENIMSSQSIDSNRINCAFIPELQKNNIRDQCIIGMINSSLSMGCFWPILAQKWNYFIKKFNANASITLTFSDRTMLSGGILQKNIYFHGGFECNINIGFQGLKSLLQSGQIKQQKISIIFISTSFDINNEILKDIQNLELEKFNAIYNISFVIICIGKNFNSNFSYQIRNIFNNIDPTLPLQFSINCDSEEDFGIQFHQIIREKIYDFLIPQVKIESPSKFFYFPWQESAASQIYSNSFVFSREEFIQIQYNNKIEIIQTKSLLDKKQCLYISDRILTYLNIMSQIQNCSHEARIALKALQQLSNQKNYKLTVWQRRLLNKNNDETSLLMQNMTEIKNIHLNQHIKNMSNEEKQMRDEIHTREHKRFDLILQMAGLSLDEFIEARNEFINLLQVYNLNEFVSIQEPSIISMQNTLDILKEQDIILALQDCQNQYELVECFPIIGYGLQIKRNKQTPFSEYAIKVISMARHHKVIDSINLLHQNYEIHLQTGQGDEEIINCILPLFEEEVYSPFIQSKLYNILLSFNITQNIDSFLDESYASLLTSCLVYLLGQPISQWQSEMLRLIKKTYKLLDMNNNQFQKIKFLLQTNPRECFITCNDQQQILCQNPNKILLIAFCNDLLTRDILNYFFIESIGRKINREQFIYEFFDFFYPIDILQKLQNITVQINQDKLIEAFYCFNEINIEVVHAFDDKLLQLLKLNEIQLPQFKENLLQENIQEIDFAQIKYLYIYFFNNPISSDFIQICFYHAYQNSRPAQRNRTEIIMDLDIIYDEIRLAKFRSIIKQNKIKRLQELKLQYEQQMIKTHRNSKPLNQLQMKLMPQLKINSQIGIAINACMSVDCPHYLEIRDDYEKHINSLSNNLFSPQIYSIIQENKYSSIQSIFDKISFKFKKQFVHQLSQNAVEVYLKIKEAQQIYREYK